MSNYASDLIAPTVKTVRTFGKLHGSDIKKGERAAADIAQEIADSPDSKTASSLIAEEVLRAAQRMATNKRGISKFERVAEELDARGRGDLADEMFVKLGQEVS